jgi:hypothetical protein
MPDEQQAIRRLDAAAILAIDPGPVESAWVLFRDGLPAHFAKVGNDHMAGFLRGLHPSVSTLVIEKVESFGMPVGAEVFETVYWSGRFAEAVHPLPVERIGRKAVKLALCGSARAKDPNIRQALIDRYGGKEAAIGRKAAPGPLYGVSADIWSALAVAVAWSESRDSAYRGRLARLGQ